VGDNARMHPAAKIVFWQRTKRLTQLLLGIWLAINLLLPWFARDLDHFRAFGFPAAYWLLAEGALAAYLAIVVVYVVVMERLEASRDDNLDATGKGAGPGSA
jgi:putative solute:sodium symporter small subunit